MGRGGERRGTDRGSGKPGRQAATFEPSPGTQVNAKEKGSFVSEQRSPVDDMEHTVRAVLTGKSPLVMHHPRTADPDNRYSAAIAEIVAKGKRMTPEDRRLKEALQWTASLYTETETETGEPDGRVIVPAVWLTRALEAGGKTLGSGTNSKGAAVFRSVTVSDVFMLLEYDGPQDITGLSADLRFRLRSIINPNPTASKPVKLPSVRAIFPKWTLTVSLNVVTYMGLSWDDFEKSFRAAGNLGIGDGRRLGYGRFSVRLTKMH